MSALQFLSLSLIALGFSFCAYATGWLMMRLLAGPGSWAHVPQIVEPSAEQEAAQSAPARPVLKLIVNSKRRNKTRLFSTEREAA